MSNCESFEMLISAAIDGELEAHEFKVLESHVDACDHCRLQFNKLQTVNDWMIEQDQSLPLSVNPERLSGEK